MSCGIYKITNLINQHAYIGLSKTIEKRWWSHKNRYAQKDDKEYNKALYRAFRKYGLENFKFEILEECSEELLPGREIYWIGYYNTYANGYNESPGGAVGMLCRDENHPNHKLTREDVIIIRTYYKNLARKKDIYSLFNERINFTGFHKIWNCATWKDIMPEIYTEERRNYHKHNTGNAGETNGRATTTEDVVKEIRIQQKNGKSRDNVKKQYPNLSKGCFDGIWYQKTWKNIIV